MLEIENIYINIPCLSREQQEQYAGKNVALVDGKIVASGKTSVEAFKKARKLFPDKLTEDIGMLYIPKAELLIL
jgi:hypothetical protein